MPRMDHSDCVVAALEEGEVFRRQAVLHAGSDDEASDTPEAATGEELKHEVR